MILTEPDQLAPVYRYFTVDLLSNEVLAEIPFGSVSYERAVKGAGSFSGKIPVIQKTSHLDLYENTIPGKTALFVVRNDTCVWGGIIWSRQYNVKDKVLDISASEFTSYFYHRRIWKTVNNQYEAVVKVASGVASVVLSNGSTSALTPGSSISLEFYEPENFRYNDFYLVAPTPTPTTSSFTILNQQTTHTVTAAVRAGQTLTLTTDVPHGFESGDIVTLASVDAAVNGTYAVVRVEGATSNQFVVTTAASGTLNVAPVAGTAIRSIADGVYGLVTVTVRTDTYDYIRSLIDAVFKDFVGIDFPNDYIEPGVRYPISIIGRKLEFGKATVQTSEPHELAIGQAVQIQDLSTLLDGEYVVTDVTSATEFKYAQSGTLAQAAVTPVRTVVTGVQLISSVVTVFGTCTGLYPGRVVTVDLGNALPDTGDLFNGTYSVATVAADFSSFTYVVPSTETIAYTAFSPVTATVGGVSVNVAGRELTSNSIKITTATPHGFNVGNSVTVTNVPHVVSIVEKSLDAANSSALITTAGPSYLSVGDSVTISGLRDSSTVSTATQSTNQVTFGTEQAHNLSLGDTFSVDQMTDTYVVSNKQLTSNVATLTLATSTNLSLQTGQSFTVSGLVDTNVVTNKQLISNVATITLGSAHNYQPNDVVQIKNITDSSSAVSKEIYKGIVTLNTASVHNFFESDEIAVSGLGAPYDGTFKVLLTTDTQVQYELEDSESVIVAPTIAVGTIVSNNSVFNGEAVIASTPSSTTFTYSRVGNDVPSVAVSGATSPVVEGSSHFNGTFTITSAGASTVVFPLPGNNVASVAVPYPPKSDNQADQLPPPIVEIKSYYTGTHVVSAMTRNTITYNWASGVTIAAKDAVGSLSVNSIFNGIRTIVAVSGNQLRFSLFGRNNVLETAVTNRSFLTNTAVFAAVNQTITAVTANTFSYAKTHTNIPFNRVTGRGSTISSPLAVVSSFGPYPGNSSLNFEYSTRNFSGSNVMPKLYRGFELTNVGEALDSYSDSLEGFEYRIDCIFDEPNNFFRKRFVLIPINFPDPPNPGEVSPLSRFGADKLVFEYPGNIQNVTIEESAENSATRFFAVGENDLGPDAGPPFSVAASGDLLNGKTTLNDPNYREWPILDDDEKIDDVDDEDVLYSFASRYLHEALPPDAKIEVEVNGSLQPLVGTYAPGDWCSLIIDDDFIKMRLQSDLEPRDDVLVRKIDSLKVTVPNGTTFPETVSLTLVPEWEVDKRG